ncbi:MAG: sulfatase-like hydrolase/transferase [Opitutales bacterium]|nr:sulfatase-like hydrolase/transferase [Opitutales bacterium]
MRINLSVLSICLSLGVLATEVEEKLPNLIIILTDDQGYHDVGFNGSKEIPTPNMDRIAHEGVRFTNGYVTNPVCGPSRAGLITGRYQGRFGFRINPTINPFDENAGLPVEEDNIAEVLAPLGYHSGIIGKWHLGTHPKFRPNVQGFDEFFGFVSGGHDYFPENLTVPDIESVDRAGDWYRTKLLRNEERVEIDEYLTDELSSEAVDFVVRNRKNPFFLFLSYNAPHTPMQATEKYLKRFTHIKDERRRIYAAMVSSIDDGVGRLLDTLDKCKLNEKTLVFFLSDNGGAVTKNSASNYPLRGYKGNIYEGGIRVPFAFRWTGAIPSGIDYDFPVSSLDILGTMAAVTDAKIHPDRPLDGVNLIPYLNGKKSNAPHPVLFWERVGRQTAAVRKGDSKWIRIENQTELYDLNDDVGEQYNLLTEHKLKSENLENLLENWSSEMKPPIFDPLGTWNPSTTPK